MHGMLKTALPCLGAEPVPSMGVQEFLADRIWPSLAHLEDTYPGFSLWYRERVIPGLATGERRLFVDMRDGSCGGVVIAKRDAHERKLCTVWVAETARGRGVAGRLMDEAIDWLEDACPLLTVPEERLNEFLALARRRRFQLTQKLPSFYRLGRAEYVFNGLLRADRMASN